MWISYLEFSHLDWSLWILLIAENLWDTANYDFYNVSVKSLIACIIGESSPCRTKTLQITMHAATSKHPNITIVFDVTWAVFCSNQTTAVLQQSLHATIILVKYRCTNFTLKKSDILFACLYTWFHQKHIWFNLSRPHLTWLVVCWIILSQL